MIRGCFAVCALLLSGCSVSPEKCNPAEPYLFQSVICQGQYNKRSDAAVENLMKQREALDAKESELSELERRQVELDDTMKLLNTRHQATQKRIEILKLDNTQSSDAIGDIETQWRSVNSDIQEIEALQASLDAEESSDLDELDDRIQQLTAEQAELEDLLLDIEL